MKNSEKIIVALDIDSLDKAKKLVKTLWPRVKFFKIGLEMISTGEAPELIKWVNQLGGKIFYDIKLNDIPNTIARTVRVISRLKVWGFTVHASAGEEAIRAAVANKRKAKVIGVTIPTSLETLPQNVIKLAEVLVKEGVDALVCSAQEAAVLKRFRKIIIVPGIRPAWSLSNDQKRFCSPAEAIKAGADYLVIGRPITYPPKEIGSSLDALNAIIKEIE